MSNASDDVFGEAVGTGGGATVGVIVAFAYWPSASATWYVTGEAVP